MQKRWCYRLPAIHLAHLLLSKHLPLSRKKSRAMLPTRVGNALRIELIDFLRPNGAVRSGDNRKIMKISYKTLWWSFQIRWSDKVEFPNDMKKLKTMLNTNQQHFTKPSSFRWKPEVFQCRPTSWYNTLHLPSLRPHLRATNGPFLTWPLPIAYWTSPSGMPQIRCNCQQATGGYPKLEILIGF